MVLLDR